MAHAAVVKKMHHRVKSITLTPKPVHINDDKGGVDNGSIKVSISAEDQVTWFAHGNQRATVAFDKGDVSPFDDSIFQVPAGGSVSSGRAKHGTAYGPYKYSVTGPAGKNDPVVIIEG